MRWSVLLALLLPLVMVTACETSPAGDPPILDSGPTEGISPPPPDGSLPDLTTLAEAAPDGSTCPSPNPFVPPGQPAGWKHTSTQLLVVTQGAPNHRGQDVVVSPGQSALLVGKFAYGLFDKDLKNEDVEIYFQPAPPCGPWQHLGTQETSEEGEHGTTYGITDDGGRIFFTLPPGQVPLAGRYPVRMLVRGDHSMAAFTLFVLQPGTSTVVFDIDGTLTTDDFELVAQIFSQLGAGTYVPKAYPAGSDVVKAWVAKGYLPVYLTGRPDQLRLVSQKWLVQQGVPPGVMHLTDTNSQSIPGSATAKYKGDFLKQLAGGGKASLYAAYGNATSDIQAYQDAGVDKGRTFIIGKHGGEQGTVALKDYPSHLPAAAAMPTALVPGPADTFGW